MRKRKRKRKRKREKQKNKWQRAEQTLLIHCKGNRYKHVLSDDVRN
jgi:hypothetical protein